MSDTEKLLLVKFDMNWCDVVDVKGFSIFTQAQWEVYQFMAKYCVEYLVGSDPFSYYFASSQEFIFDNFKDFISGFKVEELPLNEVDTVRKFLDEGEDVLKYYGHFPDFEVLEDQMDDQFFTESEVFIGIEAAIQVLTQGDEDIGDYLDEYGKFIGIDAAKEVLKKKGEN